MTEQNENDFPLVSIIISNYNSKGSLAECLSSLLGMSYPNCEIIVVDAASTDGSAEFVEENFPKVKLIREKRIGIGEAINVGIRASKGKLVVIDFNSDEVASPEWLCNLYVILKGSPWIGAIGGARIKWGSDNIIDSAGGRLYFFGHQSKIGEGRKYEEYPKTPREVDYLGCMLLERKIVDRIGLLDEAYFIYGEDADYSIRVKKAGYKVVCAPEAITYHKVSYSVGEQAERQKYFLRRAETRLVLKNGSLMEILFSMLWTEFLIFIDALMLLPMLRALISKSRFAYLYEMNLYGSLKMSVKALLWNLVNMSLTCRERQKQTKLLNSISSGSSGVI